MAATRNNTKCIVQLLVNDIRLNIHAQNKRGRNAKYMARKNLNEEMITIINTEVKRRQNVAAMILRDADNLKLPVDIINNIGSFV